ALAALFLLLGSEERAVFFIELLLVRRGGLCLDLGDEIVTNLFFDFGCGCGLGDGDRLGLRLRLELRSDLRFASDVDPPARKLRREPGVLALFADGERELPVRHDDIRRLVLGDDIHPDHVGGLERVRDEPLRTLGPLDDVDLLAAELIDDRLHPQAPLPDAGPAGVDPRLPGTDRDLCTRAGFAGDANDLHLSVEDLRTSSSKSRFTRALCARLTMICGPRRVRRTSRTTTLRACPAK